MDNGKIIAPVQQALSDTKRWVYLRFPRHEQAVVERAISNDKIKQNMMRMKMWMMFAGLT